MSVPKPATRGRPSPRAEAGLTISCRRSRSPNPPPEVGRRLEQRLALLFLAGGARRPNPQLEVGRRLEQRLALQFLAGGARRPNPKLEVDRRLDQRWLYYWGGGGSQTTRMRRSGRRNNTKILRPQLRGRGETLSSGGNIS